MNPDIKQAVYNNIISRDQLKKFILKSLDKLKETYKASDEDVTKNIHEAYDYFNKFEVSYRGYYPFIYGTKINDQIIIDILTKSQANDDNIKKQNYIKYQANESFKCLYNIIYESKNNYNAEDKNKLKEIIHLSWSAINDKNNKKSFEENISYLISSLYRIKIINNKKPNNKSTINDQISLIVDGLSYFHPLVNINKFVEKLMTKKQKVNAICGSDISAIIITELLIIAIRNKINQEK